MIRSMCAGGVSTKPLSLELMREVETVTIIDVKLLLWSGRCRFCNLNEQRLRPLQWSILARHDDSLFGFESIYARSAIRR